jgi:diaminohydroxyphosphoribosylaminopyrimidine deaminase/5-amino-6-(5-phosphoribosylamino)uracil reductase
MRRALELAADPHAPQGPNPRVGAVVLDPDGCVVGEGHHKGAGTPHAEVDALRDAGVRARGATAVVTLEPCNHTGRTGPCTSALIDAGIARVVYGQADRGRAAAGGADRLRAAGLSVEGAIFAEDAEALNPVFTFAITEGRPFVTYKFAATLDGRTAAGDGSSQWITGPDARDDAHRLRAEVDAILVGTGTAFADNPQLTVRGPGALTASAVAAVQPLRVVVGNRVLAPGMHLLDDTAPMLQVRTHDPAVVLNLLEDRGVHHALLEGGPTLAAAFFRANLVDRVVTYLSPTLIGSGPAAISDIGIKSLDEALRLQLNDVAVVGNDVRITASVVRLDHSRTDGT